MSLNDPFTIFVLMAGLGGIGYMAKIILDKLIFGRIKRTKDSQAQLRKDFETQGKTIEDRICRSNKEILDAIKDQSDSMVRTNDCESTQALLREQRDSWIKIQNIKSEADAKAHGDIIKTITGLIDQNETLMKCMRAIQNKKECDTI